jgi:hypothetical protein
MSARIYREEDGTIEKVWFDHDTGLMHKQRTRDVEGLIEANKALYDVDNKRYKNECFNLVGRIDTLVAEQWCNTKGIKYAEFLQDPKHVANFLNDPDNRAFKTKPGKVGR